MADKMLQQDVNLYQPVFRAQHKLLSASALGLNLAALAAGLLVITLVSWRHVASIERQLASTAGQQAAHQRLLAEANALLHRAGSPEQQEARIKVMALDLERRQLALRSLDHSDAAMAVGFAARMQALAHQHVAGLWLTGATFTALPQGFALTGSAVNADLVPLYLQALATEPALRGTRLDRLEIQRQKNTGSEHVDFAVSSSVSLMPKETRIAMSSARAGQ
jgi:hypothetical protein